MRIMLTNDDGIEAEGLAALSGALGALGETAVIAPEGERSAVSHGLTLREPVILRRRSGLFAAGVEAYAASGTPADCVKIGLISLGGLPDAVFSGINRGLNVSTDIVYSGTLAGAFEAALLGVPGIAVSLDDSGDDVLHFETAAAVALELASKVSFKNLEKGLVLNVNVPNLPLEEVRGCRITRLGETRFHERYIRCRNPKGDDYFWIDGVMVPGDEKDDSDYFCLSRGFVSITPLRCDQTASDSMAEVRELLGGIVK